MAATSNYEHYRPDLLKQNPDVQQWLDGDAGASVRTLVKINYEPKLHTKRGHDASVLELRLDDALANIDASIYLLEALPPVAAKKHAHSGRDHAKIQDYQSDAARLAGLFHKLEIASQPLHFDAENYENAMLGLRTGLDALSARELLKPAQEHAYAIERFCKDTVIDHIRTELDHLQKTAPRLAKERSASLLDEVRSGPVFGEAGSVEAASVSRLDAMQQRLDGLPDKRDPEQGA